MFIDNTQLMTNLDAVNYVLEANGLSLVSSIDEKNKGIITIIGLLNSADRELQAQRWSWNTIYNWEAVPDVNKEVELPDNTTNIVISSQKPYRGPLNLSIRGRDGKQMLFDATKGVYTFTRKHYLQISQRLPFQDIPLAARNYIAAQAANRYNAANINDPLVRATQLEIIRDLRVQLEHLEDDANFNSNQRDTVNGADLGRYNNG